MHEEHDVEGSNPSFPPKSIKVVDTRSTYKELRAYKKFFVFRNLIDFIKLKDTYSEYKNGDFRLMVRPYTVDVEMSVRFCQVTLKTMRIGLL